MFCWPLQLTGDPLQLVELMLDEPGVFVIFDEDRFFFGCRPIERSPSLDPEPSLALSPDVTSAPRWVGLLPYEAFRGQERRSAPDRRSPPHLEHPSWHRYGAVVVIDPQGARIEGDHLDCVEHLRKLLEHRPLATKRARPQLELVEPIEASEMHRQRIERALEHIRAGNLYQVNLARRFEFQVSGHPVELLQALGGAARSCFASAGDLAGLRWVSASPELFLRLDALGRLTTRPIKGTRPRSADPASDEQLRSELDQNEKERAELAMVIDVERNDLGRISEAGSVRVSQLPHVVSHATVHHREATIVSQLRGDVTRTELLQAMMPSGSVTGAPKIRAMDLIAELEAERRGLYTGAIGYLAHDGSLQLSMAIRTLTYQGDRGHYFAGGGIVADSDPDTEIEETLWKARQLAALVPALEGRGAGLRRGL